MEVLKETPFVYAFTNGDTRNTYKILVHPPEGKRLLVRPTRRWENNVELDV
jgi:hypothetical protein